MSDSDVYELVRFKAEHAPLVAKLQTHLWSPDLAFNERYLKWKYGENPYSEVPLIYLALCGGEAVGMRGFQGARWEVGTEEDCFDAPCAGDLVIAPEHRRTGLHGEIMRFAFSDLRERGYGYVLNLSGNRTTRLASLFMGWRTLGSLDPMTWKGVDDPWETDDFRSAFSFVDHRRASGLKALDRAVSVAREPRPEAMAALLARCPREGRFRHLRDAEYFRWRYANPISEYRFLFCGGDELSGYMALRGSYDRGQLGQVAIVEWEAEDPRSRAQLLDAALAWGQFKSVSVWTVSLGDEVRDLLAARGFGATVSRRSASAHKPAVLIRSLDEGSDGDWAVSGRDLTSAESWDLRMIYSDGY